MTIIVILSRSKLPFPLLHSVPLTMQSLQNYFAYRLPCHSNLASFFRYPWEWLHQCQLHWWLPEAECLHRHTRISARDVWRILEDDLGAEERHHRHDDEAWGEVQGESQKYRCSHIPDTLIMHMLYECVCGVAALPNWLATLLFAMIAHSHSCKVEPNRIQSTQFNCPSLRALIPIIPPNLWRTKRNSHQQKNQSAIILLFCPVKCVHFENCCILCLYPPVGRQNKSKHKNMLNPLQNELENTGYWQQSCIFNLYILKCTTTNHKNTQKKQSEQSQGSYFHMG